MKPFLALFSLLLPVLAFAADGSAFDPLAGLPWYIKLSAALGAAGLFWKAVQGGVPKLLAWLRPVAIRGVDLFVALVLAHPLLRWLVIGNKENFLKTANELLDGLEDISNAIQERLNQDINAAASGQPPPAEPSSRSDAP